MYEEDIKGHQMKDNEELRVLIGPDEVDSGGRKESEEIELASMREDALADSEKKNVDDQRALVQKSRYSPDAYPQLDSFPAGPQVRSLF